MIKMLYCDKHKIKTVLIRDGRGGWTRVCPECEPDAYRLRRLPPLSEDAEGGEPSGGSDQD